MSTRFYIGGPHDYEAVVSRTSNDVGWGSLVDVQASSNQVSASRAAWSVSLAQDKSVFAAGELVTLTATATANQNVGATGAYYRIYIYDRTTDVLLKVCDSGLSCTTSARFYTGGPHQYQAVVSRTSNNVGWATQFDVQATSNEVSASRAPWSITIQTSIPADAPITPGMPFSFGANANQDVGLTNNNYMIYLDDAVTHTRVRRARQAIYVR